MTGLTPNQLRLLGELEHHGGALIVRPRRADRDDYELLETMDLVEAHVMHPGEIRYEITEAGRVALSQ
jgi:hypothetical protein